jgi:putative PIN family toxin of toxin-antitoxin system
LRVVFDTNIFISALALPGGQAEKAIDAILDGKASLIISKPILEELLRVLAEKFARDAEALSRTALFISSISETVKPRKKLSVLKDEPDNRILECALSGKADAIVTGDKAMLALEEYKGVKIISLKEFLKNL